MVDPLLISGIHDLELVARVTVEGALSGLHRSPFHGYSAEFSQYRHYRPGDDFKYVDWKLFARTDRVYTKQFRETTNVRVLLLLDRSLSMDYRVGAGASKFEYGRAIAAGLAHLVVHQGDAAGLIVHDDQIRTFIGPRGGRGHLRALLAALARTSPGGGTASAAALRRGIDLLKTRGVIAVISDLYDDEAALDAELRRAARIGHDVVVFHVLTRDEYALPLRGPTIFEDAETGLRVLAGASAGAGYAERFAVFLEGWRIRCAAYGVDYCRVRTDAALDETLRTYLLQRMRRPRQ